MYELLKVERASRRVSQHYVSVTKCPVKSESNPPVYSFRETVCVRVVFKDGIRVTRYTSFTFNEPLASNTSAKLHKQNILLTLIRLGIGED